MPSSTVARINGVFTPSISPSWDQQTKPIGMSSVTYRLATDVLRCAIIGVGIIVIICLWKPGERLVMHIALVSTFWLGGSGVVIIGALYTRWGNTIGAYAGMLTGVLLTASGMVCQSNWVDWYGHKFPFTGQEIYFYGVMASLLTYIAFSLVFGRGKGFDLDKLLHRGQHNIEADHHLVDTNTAIRSAFWEKLKKAMGYSKEFTRGDKVIYAIIVIQMFLFMGLFAVMTTLHLIFKFTDVGWANFFRYKLWYYIVASFAFSVWLGIGGFYDFIQLFKDLKVARLDAADDGRVAQEEGNQQENDICGYEASGRTNDQG